MEQSGNEWLAWRRKGIGSSDAAAILEKSPYMTPYDLFLDKLGLRPEVENEAMKYGKHFEESARARASFEHQVDYVTIVAEHANFAFLKASLDGWNDAKKEFLEIKYVGKEKMEKAKLGEIPEHYMIQMQHQFLVTGSERAWYVCYTLTKDRKKIDEFHILEVKPDLEFIEKTLLPKETEFWNRVQSNEAPPMGPKDQRNIDDNFYNKVAQQYIDTKNLISEYEKNLEAYKKILEELLEKAAIVNVGGIKIQRAMRKGSVQYKDIPELKDVDLDKYRAGPTSYIKIDVVTPKK